MTNIIVRVYFTGLLLRTLQLQLIIRLASFSFAEGLLILFIRTINKTNMKSD